ncbi:hypothetical protein GCM10027592_38180 [Spirosoma flavus]
MNIDKNKYGKSSRYVNWLTIWGFVFGCIAFNLYFDNRQNKLAYRTQYKLESQRADSLYKETIRLEQRLQKLKTNAADKLSTRQSSANQQLPTSQDL